METLGRILAVAAGGAAGAVARYLIGISPLREFLRPFPLPTFLINVSGSFLIGFLLVLFADRWPLHENLRLALMVGFLGAYTTFSTFELELWNLLRDGSYAAAALYLFLSVAAGFAGVAGGIALARRL